MEYLRDLVMYAAVFGFFGFCWFGWAQENPPQKWRLWLGIASGVSFILSVIGGVLAATDWGKGSALVGPSDFKLFGVVVAIEVALIIIGSLLLTWKKRQDLIASWTVFVVGAHFVPLAVMFKDNWLNLLAAIMMLMPVLAWLIAQRTIYKVNTLACVFAGTVLIAFGVRGLILFLINS